MVRVCHCAVRMKADLHCHSTYSDGSLRPDEIVLLAKQKGFDAVVVTDHDTARGTADLRRAAQEQNLQWLSGIEVSAVQENLSVHVLGYSFDAEAPALLRFETRVLQSRRERAYRIIEKLQALGIALTKEDLLPFEKEGSAVGRPHIAKLLLDMKRVKSIQEAFFNYLAEGKVAYVPHERPSLQEAISLIHEAGGVAILAHPQLYRNKQIVDSLISRFDIDGIEAYYCRFSGQETQYWVRYAEERDLLVTGGSDFHGAGKEETQYGVLLAPDETVAFLLEKMKTYYGA